MGFAQTTITSEKYFFSYETTKNIELYDTESIRVVGYENNDLAVDTEIFYPSEVASDYFLDLSKTTKVIASQLSLYEVKTPKKLRNVAKGYYVRATDIDGDIRTPVFVVVMYHPDKSIIYETTIYCYDKDIVEGENIAKSFKLLY
ncbi:hypothetical protein [Lacinutrix sp.]|uniref:hypothetical protein n=3 Tax=Lacinutrix sp. TaxID=1937692 RepID=UPI002603283B|nr:hypothetical protein [Lacinutrix sp.]MDG1715757.1 hypothetical protein [Lacinutrix sp.]